MWAESGLNSSSVREERQVRGLPARPQGNPGGMFPPDCHRKCET